LTALLCVMAQLLRVRRHLTPGASSWPAAIFRIKQQAAPLEIAASCLERMTKEQASPAKSESYFGRVEAVRITYSL
jgi:hypothetical protein